MLRTKLIVPMTALAFAGLAACADGPTTPTPTDKPSLDHASTCTEITNFDVELAVPVISDNPTLQAAIVAAVEAIETTLEGLHPGVINCGQLNSLAHKIENALAAAARGDCGAAINILNATVNEVEALLGATSTLENQLNTLQNAIRAAVPNCPDVL